MIFMFLGEDRFISCILPFPVKCALIIVRLIFNEISCDSLQISWGQCPRVPGKRNGLVYALQSFKSLTLKLAVWSRLC